MVQEVLSLGRMGCCSFHAGLLVLRRIFGFECSGFGRKGGVPAICLTLGGNLRSFSISLDGA